jgi:hypothetical protein
MYYIEITPRMGFISSYLLVSLKRYLLLLCERSLLGF